MGCTQRSSAIPRTGKSRALSIIGKHRGLVLAMATALVTHPEHSLNAAEIDAVIAQTLANEAMAAEQARRIAWRRTLENAGSFTAFDSAVAR